jgi:MFS family permease
VSGNIWKLGANSFFAGLVLWYGVEKSYMLSIGITPFFIGIAVVVLQVLNVVLDIPTGLAADHWPRKRVLMGSAVALVTCSVIMALSTGLALYCVGVGFYALHVVTAATTSDALVYDTLKENQQDHLYSKYGGRVGSLNFFGYAAAGFVSSWLFGVLDSYRLVYLAAVVPALLCFVLAASLREPQFHRPVVESDHPVRGMLLEVWQGSRKVAAIGAIRALFTIMCLLWIVEAFKEGFGQLYFLRYASEIPLLSHLSALSDPAIVSLLFGCFYGIWALGEWVAHLFVGKMTLLVFGSVIPVVVMCVVDSWIGVVAFMVQAFVSAMLFVHIRADVHDVTPSHIRASVMSVKTFVGRMVSIIALPFVGLAMEHGNAIHGVWVIAPFAVLALVVWLVVGRRHAASASSTANIPLDEPAVC